MRARTLAAAGAAAVTLLATVVTPTALATPVPWRFAGQTYTDFSVGAGATGSGLASCPAGYLPVSGGLVSVSPADTPLERVAEYREGDTGYRVVVHNYGAGSVTYRVGATCALAAHVEPLTRKTANFERDVGSGLAGGTVDCGSGNKALLGGADWNAAGSTRRIDLTAVTADGQGFYVTGWTPTAGDTLYAEAWCIPTANLGSAFLDTSSFRNLAGEQVVTKTLTCQNMSGYRAGQGGVLGSGVNGSPNPYAYTADTITSAPVLGNPRAWAFKVHLYPNVDLRYTLWCLPASMVTVTFTDPPPTHVNTTSAGFAFSVADEAGEELTISCRLDGGGGAFSSCVPGSPITLSGMSEGQHTISVLATNVSGYSAQADVDVTVDLTAPHVVGPPGVVVPVTGPMSVGFDEQVNGVSGTSMTVTRTDGGSAVPGTVTYLAGTATARWSPAVALVPGEHYTLSLTGAITDLAGNALAPASYDVRAATSVENTSPAMVERWDPDTNAKAKGGVYAVSPTAGSTLTWKVKTAAGQRASLFGVRTPRGGYADVRVDGVRKQKLSFYAATPRYGEKLFTTAALKAGTHTVQLKVLGTKPAASSGTEVAADALVVGSKVNQERAARQVFRRVAAAGASGGSYDVVSHRRKGDTGGQPAYVLAFRGTGVTVYAAKLPSSGKAEFLVDGVSKGTVRLHSTTAAFGVAVFNLAGLADKRHTLRIVCLGTRSGASSTVALDRVEIAT